MPIAGGPNGGSGMNHNRPAWWCIGLGLAVPLALVLYSAPASAATPPDVGKLVRRMKVALEPARPSVRKLTITISAQDGEATRWVVGQARKQLKDGSRILTVILAPPDQKGTAFLMLEGRSGTSGVEQAVYIPAVRRVRTLLPVEGFRAFLESDFTLADLGFVSLRATYRLLGVESHKGVRAYKIQEVPGASQAKWYYSRIVTWIAADSSLPLERDFYDPSGTLWKVETFEQVTDINGIPTILRLRMEDREEKQSSEINVSEVRYDVDLPDNLFERTNLPRAAAAPLW
jgi:hypothetical protein